MDKIIESNQVIISGEVKSQFEYSHELYGEKFYTFVLDAERISGVCDSVVITVSERLIDVNEDYVGKKVCVLGQFRSYNKKDGDKKHLVLSVFARELYEEQEDGKMDKNAISLKGYLCKNPVYRQTPSGREIADLLLAVNRSYGKTDYIPCICWGRNALFVSTLDTGTHIEVTGRIQSRIYNKKISDTEFEERTAYEVSLSVLEVVGDEE